MSARASGLVATASMLAILAACATVSESGRGSCDASRAQVFVGAIGTADVGRVALRRTGARVLRWLPVGAMTTMDYRADRLDVRLDARNFISAISCG